MVSPTGPSQAVTISLCFAHSQGSESVHFHFCRRCLHLVCPVGMDGHRCCNATPGTAALPLSSQGCPHFMPQSHEILMLLFKVWAFFQEDFQDCRQGSGDALTSVWSVSPRRSELPSKTGAHQPVSSVWRCSIPSSKSQRAEFNVLFITSRDKFIFVSITFTGKCCI